MKKAAASGQLHADGAGADDGQVDLCAAVLARLGVGAQVLVEEQVVEAFLRRHGGFRLAEHIALVPPDRAMDGAFAAAIRRD